ncbi:hypothetical protein [Actinomadura macra]|uniref:hypothetical protein n=1 Tax=Actinomadura macra TaxID=46164 RepID=UPI0008325DD0|nr:hypothetical protein [Actinomadura macra]
MRYSPRLIRSCGALAAAATAVTGLMLGPAATADTPDGQNTATAAAAGSLHAWRGQPSGPPDQVFEGFECQNTDYRFSSWQVASEGAPELWMAFEDPNCESPSGFINPNGEPETRNGVGSVQRWR